jgi:hypothetical protein
VYDAREGSADECGDEDEDDVREEVCLDAHRGSKFGFRRANGAEK